MIEVQHLTKRYGPFTAVNDANYRSFTPIFFQGINKASYTTVLAALVGNTSQLLIFASGMGQAADNVTTASAATGGTVILGGAINYVV